MKGIPVPPCPCPSCGTKLDRCSGFGHANAPAPGDLTVCAACGAFLQYTESMEIEPFRDSEFLSLPMDVQQQLERARRAVDALHTKRESHMMLQIATIKRRAADWRAAHPHEEVLIRWNYPTNVMPVMAIDEAVKQGLVIVNEAGLELLKALGDYGERSAPTISMCRAAIEDTKHPLIDM